MSELRDEIFDVAVVGGGLMGSAIAYGLRRLGKKVVVLDEGDIAYRASRGNFGLVWAQSKGMGLSRYAAWTVHSARSWPDFAGELLAKTGIDVGLAQPGGLHIVLSEAERDARIEFMTRLLAQPGMPDYPWRFIERDELRAGYLPGAGPDVVGATWTPIDGIANPLKLLFALHRAFALDGVVYRANHAVASIKSVTRGYALACPSAAVTVQARQVVLAAGIATGRLAAQVGLDVPVRPQRGQIIALERTQPVLSMPMSTVRQMPEGTWLIGDSQEEAGDDDVSPGLAILGTLAERAVRTLPALAGVRVIRTWAALRVMSRDGYPVYDEAPQAPGVFVAICHSGVTLAAAHALSLAGMIASGGLPEDMQAFSTRRFHV